MRALVITFALSLLVTGCNDATQAVNLAVAEAVKSSDQRQAEELCAQAAADNEALRTPGLKKILDTPAKTQVLGSNHYLIRVTYKMVTLDDPGTTSNDLNAYSGATCEVQQGKIVSGKLDQRFMDRLRRLQ